MKNKLTQDTMHGVSADHGLTNTRVHGSLLKDPGSCKLPEDKTTITLEEWKAQQERDV